MKHDYVLDFVLPAGPTGPQGLAGPTGPTGPAALKALVYAEYATAFDSETLAISHSTILPSNTKIFSTNNTNIYINEEGVYEFTICGTIRGVEQNEDITLKVQIQGADHTPIDVNVAHFTSTVKDIYFAQTFIYELQENQTVTVVFQKSSSSNSLAHATSLIIKQLSF